MRIYQNFKGTTLQPDGSGCRPMYLSYLQGMPVPIWVGGKKNEVPKACKEIEKAAV
jgi:hypothetical protein